MRDKMRLTLMGDDPPLASILAEAAQEGGFVFQADGAADILILSRGDDICIRSGEGEEGMVLRKPFRLADLLEAANTALLAARRGEAHTLAPGILFRPFQKAIEDQKHGKRLELTDREAEFLRRVLEAGETGLTRTAALGEVWGYHPGSDSHAVDAALYRLRQKLQTLFGKEERLRAEGGAYRWDASRDSGSRTRD